MGFREFRKNFSLLPDVASFFLFVNKAGGGKVGVDVIKNWG